MKEIWLEKRIGGNYKKIAAEHGVSPIIARLLSNRGIRTEKEIDDYFSDSMEQTYDYSHLPDIEKATDILSKRIKKSKKIRIIGDYDIDGVCSTYILLKGLRKAGANVDAVIPHRITDGYGLNDHLIRNAAEDEVNLIITCDNGIAARTQVDLAHELGMEIIVTDHHEVPFHIENGKIVHDIPDAEAVVDIKCPDSTYPYKEICGAVVAFKFLLALYDKIKIDNKEAQEFVEFAAFATIGDVMPIVNENRKLVKEGLKRLKNTENKGIKALINEQCLNGKDISVYHIGFILGPCINATGRLDSAKNALDLLLADNDETAKELAHTLSIMNNERKDLTEKALSEAMKKAQTESFKNDKILVIFLPDVHESIAGIIAGKVREKTGKPTFILTKGEECVKGSGRSIDEYDMYKGMNEIGDIFEKFGGHKLAAGLSIKEENIETFREKINSRCTLSEEDLTPKIHFDMILPTSYVDIDLCRQIDNLEPFGTGNPRPVFAARNIEIRNPKVFGKKNNCLKGTAIDNTGHFVECVFFGDAPSFQRLINEKGKVDIVYTAKTDNYYGSEKAQITISNYR